MLPAILRGWLGEKVGRPGRAERVVFERCANEYVMAPYSEETASGPVLWQRNLRADVPKLFGFEFKGMENQTGIVQRPGGIFLFVTLDKKEAPEAHKYRDRFLLPTEFEWQSQNRTRQERTGPRSPAARRAGDRCAPVRASQEEGGGRVLVYCERAELSGGRGEAITVGGGWSGRCAGVVGELGLGAEALSEWS